LRHRNSHCAFLDRRAIETPRRFESCQKKISRGVVDTSGRAPTTGRPPGLHGNLRRGRRRSPPARPASDVARSRGRSRRNPRSAVGIAAEHDERAPAVDSSLTEFAPASHPRGRTLRRSVSSIMIPNSLEGDLSGMNQEPAYLSCPMRGGDSANAEGQGPRSTTLACTTTPTDPPTTRRTMSHRREPVDPIEPF